MPASGILFSLVILLLLGAIRLDRGAAPAGELSPAAAYAAAQARALKEGPAIVALARAGKARAVYAQFDSAMRQFVTGDGLQQILNGMLAVAPISERVGETALITDVAAPIYICANRYGKETLVTTVVFDKEGKIAGFSLRPYPPMPPDPKSAYKNKTALRLPFDGEWWVFWGGDTPWQNYHVQSPDQRHAYDFCVWKEGATHHYDGSRNEHYWAWGQPVLAPADATVVAAKDGVKDNVPKMQTFNPSDPAGNHVFLDFGNAEFALIAHLQCGSLRVKTGDRVRRGQILGLCGNSGNTTEPHVHIHLQDRTGLFHGAVGLPLHFCKYIADGHEITSGAPVQGQFIHDAETDANAALVSGNAKPAH